MPLVAVILLALALFRPVLAQDATGPFLRLLSVVDDAYPTVSIVLDVRDENGMPLTAPAVTDFSLEAAGAPVDILAVTQDESAGLDLVFVLDQSTSAPNWAQTQAIVDSTLATLRPQDRVAILGFADDVELLQPLTSSVEDALGALAQAAPGGQFSASYPAMIEAVNLLAEAESRRGVVIAVADAPDNISQQTPEQVIAAAQAAGLSIAIASYGPGEAVAAYNTIAAASGGRRMAAAEIDELQAPIVEWVASYLPGWRVDFEAEVAADNTVYPLTVVYAGAAGTAQAEAEFTAQLREVSVAFAGLEEGQPVAGVIDLRIEATVPAPPVEVEYRVDGASIGAATSLDPFAWDTSQHAAGAYPVEVLVTDSAGNTGRDTISLQIVQPAVRLALLEVDSSAFPQVIAHVDAFGTNGLPLVGLTAAAFEMMQNGTAIPQAEISIATGSTQPLGIVLVLDRSVSVGDWAQIRAAANTMIDTLRPDDEIAIYAFAGDVTLVQAATANHGAAKAALAAVDAAAGSTQPDAGTNALHAALLDAVNLADILPQSRVAVVAVTDGLDDTGAVSIGQLTGVLGAQAAPVHLLAFGTAVENPGLLSGLARLTGGNAVTMNSAADLRSALQTLASLLQDGYRLEYHSALAADNGTHALEVTLAAQGRTASASGSFAAVPGTVAVLIPQIAPDATVAGSVNLTAQASAPAPIVSVVYRLNGDVLAEVEDIDFTIMWNSDTVTPGAYTLEVTVTDAVGNTGTESVAFTVIAPIALAVDFASSDMADGIEAGERVDLAVQIDAVHEGVRVEAAVDGVVVASADRAPYSISFGTGDLAPGARTITVVATDREGYQAVEELPLTLRAPEAGAAGAAGTSGAAHNGSEPGIAATGFLGTIDFGGIARWLGIGAVGIVLLIFLWWVGTMIFKSRRERKLTPVRMTLSNLGNAATAYLLRGEDPERALSFEFWLQGERLGLPPVARLDTAPATGVTSTGQGRYAPVAVESAPQSQVPQEQYGDEEMMGEGGAGNGMGGWAGVGGRIQEVGMVASILATILTSVSMFLPRGLSQPVRKVAMQLRRGLMMTRRVGSVQRQVGRLNKTEMGAQMVQRTQEGAAQVGQAATSDAARQAAYGVGQAAQGTFATAAGAATSAVRRSPNPAYAAGMDAQHPLYSMTTNGQANGRANGHAGNGAIAGNGVESRQWVYVPKIQPGDTLTIDVLVGSTGKAGATRHHPFRLVARALEDEAGIPVIEEGSVRLQGAAWWRRNLLAILGGFAVLVAILSALIWWL